MNISKQQKMENERNKFLDYMRNLFEPKYGRKLTPSEVEEIADNLTRYSVVCHNIESKRRGLKPKYAV
jgi:hypothetical protein